ncbi:MAG TPA: molybdate ABC transporter substrate-binding protein [Blastocatellia bacterium]|nr:molybdate ABC transporter substrate-binding protein [Blastocatellia bacterium]
MNTRSTVKTKAPSTRIYFSVRFAVIAVVLVAVAPACSRRSPSKANGAEKEILIAAAADLGSAFEELKPQFELDTGIKVRFSFGSTGTLAQQIENGAPVDLFAAANVEFVDRLNREGLILPDTKALYARGRITIWTRADSQLRLEHIQDLAQPGVKRVAIANPEHAPYGEAAREALQSAGVWSSVEPKVVFGENVRQTMQFAESGNVDAAIAALSLSVLSDGRWVLIPEDLHKPLDQALAVIKGSRAESEARQFALFINGPKGRPVMRKYGFVLPGEEASN